MKINIGFQKSALIICCLPIIAFFVAYFTRDYRYSEHKYIYGIGSLIIYGLWFLILLLGSWNSVLIKENKNLKLEYKIFWIFLSLLPIIYIVTMLIIGLIIGYIFNDDIILPNGERIDGHYRGYDF